MPQLKNRQFLDFEKPIKELYDQIEQLKVTQEKSKTNMSGAIQSLEQRLVETKKALTDLTSGQVLKIVATDPGAVKDFQAFSKQTGNALLSSETEGNEFVFFMRKK